MHPRGRLKKKQPSLAAAMFYLISKTHEPIAYWNDFNVLGRCGGADAGKLPPTISAHQKGAA